MATASRTSRVTHIVFNRNRQESQMYSSLTAAVLCIAMHGACAAQGVAPASVAQQARPGADLNKTKAAVAAPAAAAKHSGGELIKTAAASTHDELPGVTRGPRPAAAPADDEQHHRGGPAMLLAALALMSGIALRRFGAHKQ
jgi:hypothetical protein